MQKLIKKDLSLIRYFEDDVNVEDWIDLNEFRLMSDLEAKKHETNPYTTYHAWCNEAEAWIDPRTEEEILEYKRSQYPKLTRYQFMRGMWQYGYRSADIEALIMAIEDEHTRELTMLGFKEATNFERNNQSVTVMRDMLGKTGLEIDEFWELSMTF